MWARILDSPGVPCHPFSVSFSLPSSWMNCSLLLLTIPKITELHCVFFMTIHLRKDWGNVLEKARVLSDDDDNIQRGILWGIKKCQRAPKIPFNNQTVTWACLAGATRAVTDIPMANYWWCGQVKRKVSAALQAHTHAGCILSRRSGLSLLKSELYRSPQHRISLKTFYHKVLPQDSVRASKTYCIHYVCGLM